MHLAAKSPDRMGRQAHRKRKGKFGQLGGCKTVTLATPAVGAEDISRILAPDLGCST